MSASFAYSTLQFKAVDADLRIVEGIASTPAPDRIGDIMEPAGAKYTLPMPLLWQHRADRPIGKVLTAAVTAAGIRIRAQIGKDVKFIDEEIWPLIKAGLVSGLSIGFRPIDMEPLTTKGGGFRIKTWDWFELSAVSVPMNAATTITAIKSADAPYRLQSKAPAVSPSPAVAGSARKDSAMTHSEMITSLEAERATKRGDLEGLLAKDSLTDEETTERDSLTSELERLRATIKSYRAIEADEVETAAPVTQRKTALPMGEHYAPPRVDEPKLPPGIAFARMILCKCASQLAVMRGDAVSAVQIAKQWYPESQSLHLAVKAAVAPATTQHATWAAPLVYNTTIADFVEYLRPKTIIGQFGTNGIPSMNRVPFNMRQVVESSAMTGYWVGEGKPKPLTSAGYTAQTLGFAKVAAITVDTEEILRFSNHPTISAEEAMRNGLTRALVAKIDVSLIDPTLAAVANVNPASLTYNVALGASAGNTADDVRTDILSLYAAVGAQGLGTTDNIDPRGVVLLMPPGVALSLGLMRTTVGVPEFPAVNINGGSVQGIPVIVSNYLARPGYGNMVVAVVAPEVNLADDGQVTVDMSREASLEMSDTPTQSGTTGVSLVSLWQDNLVAFRAERFINWGLRRAGVVAVIQSVNWGGVGSPT